MHQIESGIDDASDNEYDDEEDDDYEDDGQHRNMIIIHQQNMDDKKVVYLSNINSCSLPQTPKIDDSVNTLSAKNTISQGNGTQNVKNDD